ncbi:hypothetical protein [Sporosarcina sp. BP05]|uniref:hypothetical protein n=1 Tax=Sporosarcina sp. BP05 TaxID=2758726 RepID=UPI00351C4E3E
MEKKVEEIDYLSADVEYKDNSLYLNENGDLSYRYCTKALMKGEQIDMEMLRNTLVDLGESLIVAGSPINGKIYTQTNHP